jgi:hypothetical protein
MLYLPDVCMNPFVCMTYIPLVNLAHLIYKRLIVLQGKGYEIQFMQFRGSKEWKM